MKKSRRHGFSLLEVMLATTVLLGSVIVLSHISFVGTAHMDAARQYAAAQLACQARMNEMLAGARPIEEVSAQRIRELPGWGLTVKIRSASRPGLLAIEVTAAERQRELSAEATSDESAEASEEGSGASQLAVGTGKQFTLVRWIADPEKSESPDRMSVSDAPVPVDVPGEPSLFDDSVMPGEPPFPDGPMPPDEFMMPQEPPLPEEPSMFDEPMPEI